VDHRIWRTTICRSVRTDRTRAVATPAATRACGSEIVEGHSPTESVTPCGKHEQASSRNPAETEHLVEVIDGFRHCASGTRRLSGGQLGVIQAQCTSTRRLSYSAMELRTLAARPLLPAVVAWIQ
jgi:hypothetical protein